MIRIKTLLIFLLLIPSLSTLCQDAKYEAIPFIENYKAEEYNAGIQNWDITQAQDGRLYVANNLGLLEYDGSTWKNHQIKYGTKLRSLLADGEMIYVGSQNDFGYFAPNETGQLQYTSLADSLDQEFRSFDETWKIYRDNESTYFCTFNNIFQYKDEALSVITSNHSLEISFHVNHELYIQEWENGLSKLNKHQEIQLLNSGEFFKTKRISSILPYSKKELLITTFNDGIYLHAGGAFIPKRFDGLPEDMIINTASILQNGKLVIGTQTNGVFIINEPEQDIMHINKSAGLMDNTINSVYEDSSGSLWLSLNNGISRIDLSSPLSIIDERSGVSGAGYAALEVMEKTFLGTNNGAYQISNGHVSFIDGSEGQVYNIQELNGDVYIGHHRGLMLVENGKAKLLSDEKGAWKLTQHPDLRDKAILGTYTGLRIFDLNKQKVVQELNSFTESSRVMAFDETRLWVTQGYKGAFRVELNDKLAIIEQPKLYNSKNGFPTDFLINVFEIDGQLVFTGENGFYHYDEASDSFLPHDNFNEQIGGNASIVDMDEDPFGNIYFIERDKIGMLTPKVAGGYDLNMSSFGLAKSEWNDDLGNITALNNNEVLLGAREGFILYDRRKDNIERSELKSAIDEIKILGLEDSILYSGHGEFNEEKLTFPFRHNSLGFKFYAADFKSGDKTQYQFFLENYQEDWSEWSTTSYKEFTNLKEGKYAFHIRAKNLFDQESEIKTFEFTIKPPIYRTTGAYIFYSSGTLFLLFLGFKTLDYRHKEETKALEKAKNEELEVKEEEIKEIAERSEKQLDDLRSQKLEAELKLKSQDLTSSAMHLIQKNELLTQVKQTLKGLDKNSLDATSNSKLRSLVRQIDKDLASGEEWAQFENNFDQVHGNFITRLKEAYPKLTPQEIKFSAYIRMNLNTKEIANLLNISVRGVEIGRYRVRKKLELERKDNLSDFLMRF